MRLYASKKEAQVLQLALAFIIANGNKQDRYVAQALLQRIADCLTMQTNQKKKKSK